jgi:hypothetical protein
MNGLTHGGLSTSAARQIRVTQHRGRYQQRVMKLADGGTRHYPPESGSDLGNPTVSPSHTETTTVWASDSHEGV